MNKGGLASIGILFVICFASVFPAKASTGIILPMLMVGDFCAIFYYWRVVDWVVFRKMLPPALLGVCLGSLLMGHLSERGFAPLIGWTVVALIVLQLTRRYFGERLDHIFESRAFGGVMGVLAGVTTMIANAAGPVATLYFLSVRLPKWNLIGTAAWFFFVLNCFKVPFSARMGLLNVFSLELSLTLAPIVVLGFFAGRFLAGWMRQDVFNIFLLICTAFGALRLLL
jgi:uncharacterized membrane protein YfcA